MSAEELKKLASLSKREREVLWLVCEGHSYEEISQKLYISIPTVKANMGRVYVKLGLDQLQKSERIRVIHQVYWPLLKNAELPSEAPRADIPIPVPEPVAQMVDDDEHSIIPYRPEPIDVIEIRTPERVSPRPSLWRFVIILVLGLGVLAVAYFAFFMNRDQSQLGQELTLAVAQLTQVALVQADPHTLAAAPTQVVVQPTAEPSIQPAAMVITATPPPPTAIPATSAPTFTPAPSIPLPFSDSFDNEPSSQWQVFSGNWITMDEEYTTAEYHNGWALAALDDPTWKNYRLQVDVNVPHMYAASQGQLGIMVRISSDQPKYLGFTVDGLSRGSWSYVTVDETSPDPIAGFGKFEVPPQFLLEIEVRGNQFVAKVNGQEIQSLSISGYDSGGIALGVTCITNQGCPGFDNLKIEPLP